MKVNKNRLRELMERTYTTEQDVVAEGVSSSEVARALNGRDVCYGTICQMCRIMGVNVSKLLMA